MTGDVFKKWLIAQLRRISYRYPGVYGAVAKARVARGQYKCAGCGDVVGARAFHRDHVVPVIDPKTGFKDWDTYIERLFCRGPGMAIQVLCKPCHKTKTDEENVVRRAPKRRKKC